MGQLGEGARRADLDLRAEEIGRLHRAGGRGEDRGQPVTVRAIGIAAGLREVVSEASICWLSQTQFMTPFRYAGFVEQ
jgi:hypothetical protein